MLKRTICGAIKVCGSIVLEKSIEKQAVPVAQ